jgi:autotransporter-associated beta strand protein
VGDTALLDDRGSASPAINISGTQTAGSVLITGTKNYTLGGSGSIASTGTLTKAGDTTLTLSANTSFAAGTFLNGGTTILNHGGNIAGGPIRFTGGSTLSVNTGSNYFTLSPDIQVDAGAVGNINLAQRAEINGSFSGGGVFNVFSPARLGDPWGRVFVNGASAGCSGTVNLSGGGTGALAFVSNGGAFDGFPNGRLHLDGISIYTRNNSGGNTYTIGSLSGTADSTIVGPYYAGTATWSVGGLGLDSEFAGSITNGTTGQLNHLIKTGSGTLTLSGANSYSGTTSISGGTLRLVGSLGNTAVTVNANATLSGSGPAGSSLLISQNAIVSPGTDPGQAGTLTIANGIDLSAATMRFDLSSNPASGNDRIVNNAGTLTLRSPGGSLGAHFDFNLTDGFLGAGTYTLVTGGSGTSAPGSPAFTHNLPGSTRQSFALNRSGGGSTDAYVRLAVTGTAGNLVWTGSTSIWDIANTTPWSNGPSGDNRFYNLDTVTFNDTAANRSVTLTGALQPNEVIVNNNGAAYTFGGTGGLAGAAKLVKSGTGTLTIGNSVGNTFTGGTTLNGGTLGLTNTSTPLGTGTITVNGGTLQFPNAIFLSNSMVFSGNSAITSTGGNSSLLDSTTGTISSIGSATVDLSGLSTILSINGSMSGFTGTFSLGSSSSMLRLSAGSIARNFGSANAHFDLGTAGATLNNRNGNITIHLGALSGGPNTHLRGRQTGSGGTSTTYIIGEKNLSTTFSGSINHGGDLGGLAIVKTGSGVLTLGGTSTYVGTLDVDHGEVAITGATTVSGDSTVQTGATLSLAGGTFGVGTLTAAGELNGNGTVNGEVNMPGNHTGRGFATGTPGVLQLTGPASFNSSILRMLGGLQSDRIEAADDLTVEGTILISLAPGTGFGRYTLVTCGGDLSLGSVALTGIPGGTTAHLSASIAGQIDLVIDDSDEDGLPDSWENQYLEGLGSGPDDDDDGDGQSNAIEFLTGTDPGDGSSRFAATVAPLAGNQLNLSWPSVPGKSYRIESNVTLSGSWTPVATVPAAASPAVTTSHAIDITPGAAFYRVALDP